jgi:protein-S-isoprenylcysteine O-methyltransferase Ste14
MVCVWLIKTVFGVLRLAALLFIPAGRLNWGMGWFYVASLTVIGGFTAVAVDPDLIAELSQWSTPDTGQVIPLLKGIGWGCVAIGLVFLIIAMARLGLSRSMGQESGKLEMSGLYHITRYPQLMGGALLVIGYVMLWPSGYTLGWLLCLQR